MTEPAQASILEILDEPWYVIVGIVLLVIAMQVTEKRLKAAGRWPYKGDNIFVDRMIWSAVLLPVAVVAGVTAHWLG